MSRRHSLGFRQIRSFATTVCLVGVTAMIGGVTTGVAGKEASDEAALLTAKKFADCTVKRRPDLARQFVVMSHLDVDKRLSKLLDAECLPDKKGDSYTARLSFPSDTLHQLVANALVRRDYPSFGPDLSTVSPTEIPVPQPTAPDLLAKMSDKERVIDREKFVAAQNWYMLTMLGDCVSRRDSDGVRSMALTDIGSTEEKAVIAKLQVHIAGCWPAGQTVRMRIRDFRGPALRAYYLLASRSVTEAKELKETAS